MGTSPHNAPSVQYCSATARYSYNARMRGFLWVKPHGPKAITGMNGTSTDQAFGEFRTGSRTSSMRCSTKTAKYIDSKHLNYGFTSKKNILSEWFVSQFILSCLLSSLWYYRMVHKGSYLHLISSRIKRPKLPAWIPPLKQIVGNEQCLREFHGKDSARKAGTSFLPLLLPLSDLAAKLPSPNKAQLERQRHRVTKLDDGDCAISGLRAVVDSILTMNSSLSLGCNKLAERKGLIVVKQGKELIAMRKDRVRGSEVVLQHGDSCLQFLHGGALMIVETVFGGISGLVLLSNSVPDLGISAKSTELVALELHDLLTHSVARFACGHVSDNCFTGFIVKTYELGVLHQYQA